MESSTQAESSLIEPGQKSSNLAFTSELALERAADVVFGDATILVDWLTGIASVVPLITLGLETGTLVKFQAERLSKLRADAFRNAEQVFTLCSGKPAGFQREAERVHKGINCFDEATRIAHATVSVRGIADGDRITREALWDALEEEAQAIERMRTAFRAEIQHDVESLETLKRQQLEQAEALIAEAVLESPLERSRLLRESRRILRDLTSETGADLSGAAWAHYCWVTWQLTANEEETMIPLEFAVSQTSSGSGPGKALCARLYAYLLNRQERWDEAYQWAYAAASIWPCVDVFHERARYAALSGRIDIARKEVEALIHCGPLGVVMAFADPTLLLVKSEILETTVREQLRLRQLARQEIANWEAMVKKTVEVRRKVPSISLPHDLTDDVERFKAECEESHFLSSSQQARRAGSAKEDLKCLTAAALQSEKRKRVEAVAVARANIEGAMQARDNWIKASMAAHEESLTGIRSVVSKSDSKGEVAQKGCGWGLSTGCAVLVTYGIFALVLGARGIMIGPGTTWGMLMLTVSALPVVLALIFHIAYSAKRMILDAQVNAQITVSRDKFEKAREEANEQFRGHIESNQEQLAVEEKLLLRVEEATRNFS